MNNKKLVAILALLILVCSLVIFYGAKGSAGKGPDLSNPDAPWRKTLQGWTSAPIPPADIHPPVIANGKLAVQGKCSLTIGASDSMFGIRTFSAKLVKGSADIVYTPSSEDKENTGKIDKHVELPKPGSSDKSDEVSFPVLKHGGTIDITGNSTFQLN